MADGQTAGAALLIAGVIGLLVSRRSSTGEVPDPAPGPTRPTPTERFEPVVFGDPAFELTLVE